MQTTQHQLACGCARTLAAGAASELHVLRGVLWFTQSGDAKDYFLGAGERIALQGQSAVVQAEGKSAATYVLRQAGAPEPTTTVKLQKPPSGIALWAK